VGVEYLLGANLYGADPNSNRECQVTAPTKQTVYVKREVILAGGAYNTPQLLMLSGIGPGDQLHQFGIPVRVDLPGVGQNLQDRYEITVIFEMDSDWRINTGASFTDDPETDACLSQWLETRTGVYTSSGSPIAFLRRSMSENLDPDLFIFALNNHFQGYFPLYFSTFEKVRNQFTWSILKAHTKNTAGVVMLKSADPLDTPYINFHYFEEGNNTDGSDLDAVAEAVSFVRNIMANSPYVSGELLPGTEVQTTDQIKQYIRDQAWGHHCSCTCKIGADDDPTAVLDSQFRVRGVKNLRVVDASVFPHIPGYFIVLPIYMISEKAADVIIQAAKVA
jgi:choline dehydrogenase